MHIGRGLADPRGDGLEDVTPNPFHLSRRYSMSRRIPPPKKYIEKDQGYFDPAEDIVFLSFPTITKLLLIPSRRSDCMALYTTYFAFLRWEGRIPHVTEIQIKLKMGKDRVLSARKLLMEQGLLKSYQVNVKGPRGNVRITKTKLLVAQDLGSQDLGNQGPISLVLRTKNNIPHPSGCGCCDKTKKKKPLDLRPSDFDKFYSAYPRKVDRPDAKKAWAQKIRDKTLPSLSALLHSMEQSMEKDWKDTDKKYIPHPSKWLRGEQWNDHVDASFDPNLDPVVEFWKKEMKGLAQDMGDVKPWVAKKYAEWLNDTQPEGCDFRNNRGILPPTGKIWKRWLKTYNK